MPELFGKITSSQIEDGTIVDADINASGITTRSKLPSAIAYEDEANLFTEAQTVKKDAQDLLTIFRDNTSANSRARFNLDAKNSSGTQKTASRIDGYLYDVTPGSEKGSLIFSCMKNGTVGQILGIDETGFFFGETNFRGGLSDAGLTTFRVHTFPNASIRLSGVIGNLFRSTVVSASTTETSLGSFTIPANVLGTTTAVRLRMLGRWINNTGAGQTLRIRVKLGATTIYDDTTASLTASATAAGIDIDLILTNDGATNSNQLNGRIIIGGTGAATTGGGDLGTATLHAAAVISTPTKSTEDTTANKTLDVTVQMSTATAGGSVTRDTAVCEAI